MQKNITLKNQIRLLEILLIQEFGYFFLNNLIVKIRTNEYIELKIPIFIRDAINPIITSI